MSDIIPLIPRQKAPSLSLPLVGGGTWTLNETPPRNFTLMVAYRGLHCPICKMYLGGLNKLIEKFAERGVDVVVFSSDVEERASQAVADWGLDAVQMAYGLSLEDARKWGLYISAGKGKTSIGIEEPALFSEPGVFMIRPDGEIFFVATQSMPFARPDLSGLIGAVDFVVANNYPARGEIENLPVAAE